MDRLFHKKFTNYLHRALAMLLCVLMVFSTAGMGLVAFAEEVAGGISDAASAVWELLNPGYTGKRRGNRSKRV